MLSDLNKLFSLGAGLAEDMQSPFLNGATEFTIPVPGYNKDSLSAYYENSYLYFTDKEDNILKRMYLPHADYTGIQISVKDGIAKISYSPKPKNTITIT